ncbi:anti-CBASS protein Acb1 family protein [Floridanema evergladense]|uniref:Anti-CBASS protein Acb1 family protein n=1 Tax=Floridaenema evergladense BLCC-F167 TaxID=3153639 RepID=A0ABV4WCX4_9CYAN
MTEPTAYHTDTAELEQLRADSAFWSLFSGLQQLSQVSGSGGARLLSWIEIDNLYRFNPFAATLVDLLPDSMTQKWVIFKATDQPPEVSSTIQKQVDKVADKFNEALKLARKYGGSVILLGADDGNLDYRQPLNERNLRTIRWLNVLSSQEIKPHSYNDDPLSPNYGDVELYQLTGSAMFVHSSRLLRFDGVKLSRAEMKANGGWGDSVLNRCYKELLNFTSTHDSIFASLKDFNQRVLKMKALATTIAQPGGSAKITDRLTQTAKTLSSFGLMALDAENEDYFIVARNYAGVLELLKHAAQIFAGATDIPPSKLLSLFNSSGIASEDSTQERYWSGYVANRQNRDLLPQLERYINLLLSTENITRGELIHYELEFPSLFQLTQQEEQALKDSQSATAERYAKIGAVTPDEVARALAEGIALESAIDLDARAKERAALVQMPEGVAPIQ